MNGPHLEDEWIDLEDGTLSADEQARLRAHLDSCEPCRHTLAQFKAVSRLGKALGTKAQATGQSSPGPRAEVSERIRAAALHEAQRARFLVRARRVGAVLVPLAAAAGIALVLVQRNETREASRREETTVVAPQRAPASERGESRMVVEAPAQAEESSARSRSRPADPLGSILLAMARQEPPSTTSLARSPIRVASRVLAEKEAGAFQVSTRALACQSGETGRYGLLDAAGRLVVLGRDFGKVLELYFYAEDGETRGSWKVDPSGAVVGEVARIPRGEAQTALAPESGCAWPPVAPESAPRP